mgnify:CR=1 FL=1
MGKQKPAEIGGQDSDILHGYPVKVKWHAPQSFPKIRMDFLHGKTHFPLFLRRKLWYTVPKNLFMGDIAMSNIGFDNQKYLTTQSEQIRKRIAMFGGKLYLEFGGKLFDDYHASRVLPGFEPDSKMRMLQQLKDDVEIVIAINAEDIERNKVRGDLGITYDADVLRLIDTFRELNLYVGSVVITRYATSASQLCDGVDGVIVPMDNEGCAQGIADLLRNPPKMKRLSENCLRGDYANTCQAEKLMTLLEDV